MSIESRFLPGGQPVLSGENSDMDRKLAFGLRLRAIRNQQGLTQEQLAELLDRSTDTVSSMERGINLPTLETLFRLNEKLGIPLRDLFGALDVTPDDTRHVELHAALTEHARRLTLRDLEIAVKQVQAFPPER